MALRDTVLEQLGELFEEEDLEMPPIDDSTVLLDTGLDSLAFAVLVTRLDDVLGYDPFSLMDEPVYPVTFGDFCAVYTEHRPEAEGS